MEMIIMLMGEILPSLCLNEAFGNIWGSYEDVAA